MRPEEIRPAGGSPGPCWEEVSQQDTRRGDLVGGGARQG